MVKHIKPSSSKAKPPSHAWMVAACLHLSNEVVQNFTFLANKNGTYGIDVWWDCCPWPVPWCSSGNWEADAPGCVNLSALPVDSVDLKTTKAYPRTCQLVALLQALWERMLSWSSGSRHSLPLCVPSGNQTWFAGKILHLVRWFAHM